MGDTHSYPKDLAAFVHEAWRRSAPSLAAEMSEPLLARLLSHCYQASLLTEELQPVTFRVVVIDPEELDVGGGPPRGYHRLQFAQSWPLDPATLRKLSPAVEFSHSLLGLQPAGDQFRVWGIIHSGPRWTKTFYNSRQSFVPLPPSLVVSVTGPGSLGVSNGSAVIAKLSGGRISAPGPEVLSADWLARAFESVREEMQALHKRACDDCAQVSIDPIISQLLAQGLLKRTLELLRQERHGATLMIVPPDGVAELEHLQIKYPFRDEEPRRRYTTLLVRLMRRLSELFADQPHVRWSDYLTAQDAELEELDESIEEFSRLLASLASVDGCVVLNRKMELLGFGAEISGSLPNVRYVHRALDIEALSVSLESTEDVGTRHRSAYRFCASHPDVVAFVLSQDGRIQLIKHFSGEVTCWDQLTTGVRDL